MGFSIPKGKVQRKYIKLKNQATAVRAGLGELRRLLKREIVRELEGDGCGGWGSRGRQGVHRRLRTCTVLLNYLNFEPWLFKNR